MPLVASCVRKNRTIRENRVFREIQEQNLRVYTMHDTVKNLVHSLLIRQDRNVHIHGRSVRKIASHCQAAIAYLLTQRRTLICARQRRSERMNQLNYLPQASIVWGHDILGTAAASLGDYGISRPIIFTVEFLEALNREYIQPGISGAVGIFTALPAH